MTDFAMCQDHDCPSRNKCFRYTAQPGEQQTYAVFDRPVVVHADWSMAHASRCDYYWPVHSIAEKEGGR